MFDRLNGWQRIGAVLTVFWTLYILILGGTSIVSDGPFNETIKGKVKTFTTEAKCSKLADHNTKGRLLTDDEALYGCAPGAVISPSKTETIQITPDQRQFMFWSFVGAAVIPPALIWLLMYALVAVVKWIAQGFQQK